MNKYLKTFLNILYPRCCPVCHQILRDQKQLICTSCARELAPYRGPRCMKCGKPVGIEEEYCKGCAERRHFFTKGRGIYLYDERMRKSIVKYKYHGRREYGDFYAAAICRYAKEEIETWKPDVIVPIPLHCSKKRARGFNQAEYLAERIGKYYDIPVAPQLLIKTKRTRSQKKLDAGQRRKNLQGAFFTGENLDGLTVLLVDDVYTTGSTMDAASSVLMEAGAKNVFFVTLCVGSD